MKEEHKRWLMEKIEKMVGHPKAANIGILSVRCDLEIIIQVAEVDEVKFTPEVIADLVKEVAEVTGMPVPVIRLEGHEPEWLAKGHYIF